jgi:hypothetical protein
VDARDHSSPALTSTHDAFSMPLHLLIGHALIVYLPMNQATSAFMTTLVLSRVRYALRLAG